jgi:hypothetical protein
MKVIDYPTMYRKLFNAQTDAIEALQKIAEKLIKVQRQTEEPYICASETGLTNLKKGENQGGFHQ